MFTIILFKDIDTISVNKKYLVLAYEKLAKISTFLNNLVNVDDFS